MLLPLLFLFLLLLLPLLFLFLLLLLPLHVLDMLNSHVPYHHPSRLSTQILSVLLSKKSEYPVRGGKCGRLTAHYTLIMHAYTFHVVVLFHFLSFPIKLMLCLHCVSLNCCRLRVLFILSLATRLLFLTEIKQNKSYVRLLG